MTLDFPSPEILAAITDINLKNVDLNNCDREPIHIPNLIQPHGVLLAVSAENYQILQVSLNTTVMLDIEPQKLLGKPLTDLLGEKQVAAVKRCLAEEFDQINPLPIQLIGDRSTFKFDGIVHRSGDFLYREGDYQDKALSPRPSLIVLDLNLPGTDGREVLTQLKQSKDLQTIPIVVFTTSSNPKDVDACYCYGVSGYIVKPMDVKRLNQLVKSFLKYWFEAVELPSPANNN